MSAIAEGILKWIGGRSGIEVLAFCVFLYLAAKALVAISNRGRK